MDDLVSRQGRGAEIRSLDLPKVYDDVVLLMHPWSAPTFSTLVGADWPAETVSDHVSNEAEKVLGTREGWHLEYEYTGNCDLAAAGDGRRDRILVSCLPFGARSLGRALGSPNLRLQSTLAAVAGLVAERERARVIPFPLVIGIGWYLRGIEFFFVVDGLVFLTSHLPPSTSEDTYRRLAEILRSVGLADGRRVRIAHFGELVSTPTEIQLPSFDHQEAEWIRPRDFFGDSPRKVTDDPAFVPVAAAALSRLLSNG